MMMIKGGETVRGLSAGEVEASRREHGANVITRASRAGFWRLFWGNLGDPIIRVLLAALGLHLLLFFFHDCDLLQTVGIGVSVLLATFVSTLSEYGSEAAFSRLLENCGVSRCRVWRRGVCEIDSTEVVVGDVLLLGAGERIPADGILTVGSLVVDQSALTGESAEVEKRPWREGERVDPSASGALLSGCTVLSGNGEMQVTAVGDATYLGGISGELQEGTRESPLKLRLSQLARQISRVGYVAAAICAVAYLFNSIVMDAGFSPTVMRSILCDGPRMAGLLLHTLTLSLTVVVVAVPEGLPMMIAVVLSANVRRMVRDNVIVRKAAGLEAAGCMNLLFTDKTGTLTVGNLRVSGVLTEWGEYRSLRALGEEAPSLYSTLSLCAHANTVALRGKSEGREAALGGNATERALLSAFLHETPPAFSVSERIPFDSARKYAAVRLASGRVLVTGAPEWLLPHVTGAVGQSGTYMPLHQAAFLERVRRRSLLGERLLLLCEGREGGRLGDVLAEGITLLAAVAFSDPLRPDAGETVRTLKGAGVQVVMLTGDSKETAGAIAEACGILSRNSVVLTGEELARLSDTEVVALLPRLSVVSRALPSDKSRLVRLAEGAGLVVGMTGDGINDAPALTLADVGFSMGSGTQVAKEAGDVVIADDNLASVSRAVLYGRTVFKSIRKFISLQLVMNLCAVGISVIGPFIGFDTPVTVVQMLWVNIIMDTLGGLAFAGEAPLPLYMKESPKRREEPILTRAISARIGVLSAFTVALSVFFLKSPWVRSFYRQTEGELCLLTAFFALFIFAGVLNCFHARTDRVRMLQGLSKNRPFLLIMAVVAAVQLAFIYFGGAVLRTMPLSPQELLTTFLFAFSVVPFGWLHLLHRRLSGKSALY